MKYWKCNSTKSWRIIKKEDVFKVYSYQTLIAVYYSNLNKIVINTKNYSTTTSIHMGKTLREFNILTYNYCFFNTELNKKQIVETKSPEKIANILKTLNNKNLIFTPCTLE